MSVRIQRILFPTDFSEPAHEAQKYAMALTEQFGAELHLIHIIPPVPAPAVDAGVSWDYSEVNSNDLIEAASHRLSTEIATEWTSTHPTSQTVEIGFCVDEIVKYARKHEIDVIVIGTHGHTGLSHLLLGSVAEKLVRLADCPVLTVHPKGHQFVIDAT